MFIIYWSRKIFTKISKSVKPVSLLHRLIRMDRPSPVSSVPKLSRRLRIFLSVMTRKLPWSVLKKIVDRIGPLSLLRRERFNCFCKLCLLSHVWKNKPTQLRCFLSKQTVKILVKHLCTTSFNAHQQQQKIRRTPRYECSEYPSPILLRNFQH